LFRPVLILAGALALAGCAEGNSRTQSASSEPSGSGPGRGRGYSHDPFPSTYRAYPGAPTLLTNVTVFDGEGGRIDNGSVLFRDGKIVEVGQGLTAGAGVTVIDGRGKYVTPGVIDIHSHLGDYPSPCFFAL